MHILIMAGFITIAVSLLLRIIRNGIKVGSNVNMRSKEVDRYHFQLRMPPLYKWVSLIASSVFGLILLLMTLFPNETVTLEIYILFFSFFLLSLFLFLDFAINKIKIDGNFINKRNRIFIHVKTRPLF